MKQNEILSLLESTGLAFSYRTWPKDEAPPLPWGVFYYEGSRNFSADGIVHATCRQVTVELYMKTRDEAIEHKLEAALTSAGLFFSGPEEYWLESEECLQIIYDFEV